MRTLLHNLVRTGSLVALLTLASAARGQESDGSAEGSADAAEAAAVIGLDGSGTAHAEADDGLVPNDVPIDVSIEVAFPDGTRGAVGQPIAVTVTMELPDGVTLAGLSITDNAHVEIFDRGAAGPDASMRLVVYRSGTYEARVAATLIDREGRTRSVTSEPFSVEIASSIVNETAPEPASSDPPMPVLTQDRRPLWAGMTVGALVLGALGMALWRRRERGDAELEDDVPSRPAWEVALEALDALAASDLLESGAHVEFHMRLSEILRDYVGARFGFAAPEMTTSEIRAWFASRSELAGGYADELLEVARDMDMVKFARFVPPREFSERCYTSTRKLVEELSARDRERAAAEARGEVVPEEEPGATASSPAPTAPVRHPMRPDGTTEAFGEREELPDNVIPLGRHEEER